MKGLDDLLLLGNQLLYKKSDLILDSDKPLISGWVQDLHTVMQEIREKYHFGRAIAAPQLGIMKRLIYVNIDKPFVIINPEFTFKSKEMFELWDDCMSFPNLLVKVKRHQTCTLKYLDENWKTQQWDLKDDTSELLQHECDHLDGILSTMRALDEKSFKWRFISTKRPADPETFESKVGI